MHLAISVGAGGAFHRILVEAGILRLLATALARQLRLLLREQLHHLVLDRAAGWLPLEHRLLGLDEDRIGDRACRLLRRLLGRRRRLGRRLLGRRRRLGHGRRRRWHFFSRNARRLGRLPVGVTAHLVQGDKHRLYIFQRVFRLLENIYRRAALIGRRERRLELHAISVG